jgi:hypothetical protein
MVMELAIRFRDPPSTEVNPVNKPLSGCLRSMRPIRRVSVLSSLVAPY